MRVEILLARPSYVMLQPTWIAIRFAFAIALPCQISRMSDLG